MFRPANVFIFGDLYLKIGDFGLAADCEEHALAKPDSFPINRSIKFSDIVGTPLYQSPEQFKGLPYNEKVDIYALGIILYELCSSFKTYMERKLSIETLRDKGKIREDVIEKFPKESSLIMKMTNFEPKLRLSAQEIILSVEFTELQREFENK